MPAMKKVKVPRTVQGVKKGKVVGARMTREDRMVLDRVAQKEDIGVCTLVRLILESYITQHHMKERRAIGRKK